MHKAKALVTFVLIAGLAAFGGSQYYANRAYRMQLEAGYVRAFRELAVHIGSLETELSKLLVANSTTQQFGGWRISCAWFTLPRPISGSFRFMGSVWPVLKACWRKCKQLR